MDLNSLSPAEGSTKNRKRIGRGVGSGHGKTSTKGHKGQKARSGGSIKAGFEGGQMPMQRRLPKRGFTPLTRKIYSIINIGQLECFESGASLSLEDFVKHGLVKNLTDGVKILSNGELTKSLTVKAHKFSSAAKDRIIAAGGSVEVL